MVYFLPSIAANIKLEIFSEIMNDAYCCFTGITYISEIFFFVFENFHFTSIIIIRSKLQFRSAGLPVFRYTSVTRATP